MTFYIKDEIARLEAAVTRFEDRKTAGKKGRRRNPPPKPYRSWYEVQIAIDLLKRTVDFGYEEEVLTWVEPAQTKKYKPDFFITTRSGKEIVVEAKGIWSPSDRKKMCYVLEQNQDKDIRLLFQRDNKIGKSRRSKRYSEWCDERNIPYAIGDSIPKEWLDE